MPSYFWLKLYHEMLDDADVAQLSDRLWRRYVECLLSAGNFGKSGLLPPLKTMSWRLRIPEKKLENDLSELAKQGFLEHTDQGWTVHKFAERQKPISGKDRAKRYRQHKKRNDSVTKRDLARHEGALDIEIDKESEEDKMIDCAKCGARILKQHEDLNCNAHIVRIGQE